MNELDFIENYHDLQKQIDIHKMIVENLIRDKKYYEHQLEMNTPHDISAMTMSDMPHGNLSPISIDRAVIAIQHIDSRLELEYKTLKALYSTQSDIKRKLNELEGIYFKVAVMHRVDHKSMQEIADELGYSTGYIKNISCVGR